MTRLRHRRVALLILLIILAVQLKRWGDNLAPEPVGEYARANREPLRNFALKNFNVMQRDEAVTYIDPQLIYIATQKTALVTNQNATFETKRSEVKSSQFSNRQINVTLAQPADDAGTKSSLFTEHRLDNLKLENFYDYHLLTVCELIEEEEQIKSTQAVHPTMTHQTCRWKCKREDKQFATLKRGQCDCYNIYPKPDRTILNLEDCDAVCSETNKSCNVSNKPHAITMKTMRRDGNHEWTVWMNIPEVNARARYRECKRLYYSDTTCYPQIEKEILSSESNHPLDTIGLIGCFTGFSITHNASLVKNTTAFANNHDVIPSECREFCIACNASYAYLRSLPLDKKLMKRKCYCTDSLTKSLPTDTCTGLGYIVFATRHNDRQIELKFLGAVRKKPKVLILARFKSGSSMTQSLFVRKHNAFTIFEPCRKKASNQIMHPVKSDRAMMMVLESLFKCQIQKLPIFLYNYDFAGWNVLALSDRGNNNAYLMDILNCAYAKPRQDCAPYWHEACLFSSMINVKVIRVLTTRFVKEFIERNREVDVLHLVRDPRGILASRKRNGYISSDKYLCWQLVSMSSMINDQKRRGARNVHEVFYEQLAMNLTHYGEKVYKEMGVEMPEEVWRYLVQEASNNSRPIAAMNERVVVKEPESHVYGFLDQYNLTEIQTFDKSCSEVYDYWPTHYRNFTNLYKSHKRQIEAYAPKDLLKQIHQHYNQTW